MGFTTLQLQVRPGRQRDQGRGLRGPGFQGHHPAFVTELTPDHPHLPRASPHSAPPPPYPAVPVLDLLHPAAAAPFAGYRRHRLGGPVCRLERPRLGGAGGHCLLCLRGRQLDAAARHLAAGRPNRRAPVGACWAGLPHACRQQLWTRRAAFRHGQRCRAGAGCSPASQACAGRRPPAWQACLLHRPSVLRPTPAVSIFFGLRLVFSILQSKLLLQATIVTQPVQVRPANIPCRCARTCGACASATQAGQQDSQRRLAAGKPDACQACSADCWRRRHRVCCEHLPGPPVVGEQARGPQRRQEGCTGGRSGSR